MYVHTHSTISTWAMVAVRSNPVSAGPIPYGERLRVSDGFKLAAVLVSLLEGLTSSACLPPRANLWGHGISWDDAGLDMALRLVDGPDAADVTGTGTCRFRVVQNELGNELDSELEIAMACLQIIWLSCLDQFPLYGGSSS